MCLKKGKALLIFEEFVTLLTEVEMCKSFVCKTFKSEAFDAYIEQFFRPYDLDSGAFFNQSIIK